MASKKEPSLRRKARALALQALYENDVSRHPPANVVERLLEGAALGSGGKGFARDIVQGATAYLEEINDFIKELAPVWPVEQIPMVDRNILRMAIFEMVYQDSTPPKVVINEAVELAKTFGSESSPRFVNGVLGALMEKGPPAAKAGGALKKVK